MHHTLLVLFALAATSVAISLPARHLEPRERMLNTGADCIPYIDPRVLLQNQWKVMQWYSGYSSALNDLELTDCLNEYGCGNFSNSWQGNVCGGRGWFKGPPSSKSSSTKCFQELAPWVLLQGIKSGNTYYKAQLARNDCYMGYNDPET